MSILDTAASLLFGSNTGGYISPEGAVKILPNLVIREEHSDAVQTTAQPIEYGAAITDHSFRLPSRLRMTYGWSNASVQALGSDFTDSVQFSANLVNFGEGYVKQVYNTLFTTLSNRLLCTVVTSKRVYKNMLIVGLQTETDDRQAYSMIMNIECEELLRANAVSYASTGVQDNGNKSLSTLSQTPSVSGA